MNPPKVRVLGIDYEIRLSNDLNLTDAVGAIASSQSTCIAIATEQSPALRRQTTLHEVFHLIDSRLSVGAGEKRVTRLSEGLFQVLRDNPDWVTYLLEEEDDEA